MVAVVNANGTVPLNLEAALEASAAVLQRRAAGGEPAHLASLDAGATAFLDVDVQHPCWQVGWREPRTRQ